jgi:phosphopantothenoylcysteine decarboxylase/phosphopantothenate--cysteine ligase
LSERWLMALAGLRILLGVSGGIAAYKSAELVRRLRDTGAEVRVVMTEAAQRFVTPLTFQALSGHPVRTSLWDEAAEAAMGHIELARWADQVLIAPASADLIARLAAGLGDGLLTTLCLASAAPLALAPAMNQQMWAHPATQANLATLRQRGVAVLGPAAGGQACGEFGPGRLLEVPELIQALLATRPPGRLAGLTVVISAGPTYEDLDPVRFLGNRSSGRMGFALADAAAVEGAKVTLVAGPVHLPTPPHVRRVDVRDARAMHAAVLEAITGADVFVAAAAVADFRPAAPAARKIKKRDAALTLALEPTPDILADVARRQPRPFLVGFAAETDNLLDYARDKLERKGLDLIVANQVGEPGVGFEADDNAVTVLWPGGQLDLARAPKRVLARELVRIISEHRTPPGAAREGRA